VTCPTNYRHEEDLKSHDLVLSFHIGLTARAVIRWKPCARPDVERLTETWRRWQTPCEVVGVGIRSHPAREGAEWRRSVISVECPRATVQAVLNATAGIPAFVLTVRVARSSGKEGNRKPPWELSVSTSHQPHLRREHRIRPGLGDRLRRDPNEMAGLL
jgi:hypothetical protein